MADRQYFIGYSVTEPPLKKQNDSNDDKKKDYSRPQLESPRPTIE